MRAWVTVNGLTLHPEKTHLGDCREDSQGFEFLGYRFEAGKRWVRKKSLMSLKDKIRAKTKRNEGNSIEYVIASLNPSAVKTGGNARPNIGDLHRACALSGIVAAWACPAFSDPRSERLPEPERAGVPPGWSSASASFWRTAS